tara:strand:+ start:76 stop:297 length:222 start_codon:yes stop_codon:yes gene_type:complete
MTQLRKKIRTAKKRKAKAQYRKFSKMRNAEQKRKELNAKQQESPSEVERRKQVALDNLRASIKPMNAKVKPTH